MPITRPKPSQVGQAPSGLLKLNMCTDGKSKVIPSASNDFEKGKNQNKLSPANIDKIIEAIRERKGIEKYAHVASLDEIKENDYNLNIPRYVDTFEEEEVIALDEVARELQDVKADIEKSTQDLFELVGSLIGTTDEAKDELAKFISLLGK